jgi:3-oxoacyl-[acyl-carrier protein] reductase
MFRIDPARSAIVTGAAKGIGKGIARVFVKAGANVLITGRNAEDAQRTCGVGSQRSAAAGPPTSSEHVKQGLLRCHGR